MAITLATGEALDGRRNEVAHIDLLLGSKSGPVGEAFASAFITESEGHTNLLAVVTPNLPAKPDTVISNKVTIKGEKQAVQLFGPAQAAVARAVVDSVAEGVIPKDQVDDLCIIVGVFIHWEADGRQEDLRLQLRGRQVVDRACTRWRAERRQGARRHSRRASPVRRRRRGVAGAAGRQPLTTQTGELPLAGLRTVVTGASSGIGRAIAVAFAAAAHAWASASGARRRPPQALADELGAEHPLLRADLSTAEGCDAIVRRGVRRARSASTSGSTTPAPTSSPARPAAGRPSASSRRCWSST